MAKKKEVKKEVTKPKPKPKPKPKSGLKSKPKPKSELKPETKPKSEIKPKPKPKSKPETKPKQTGPGPIEIMGIFWTFFGIIIAGVVFIPQTKDAIPITQQLEWEPAENAEYYEVYLGTDKNAVETANTESPEFKGRNAVASFNPGILNHGIEYYWRVDSVNPYVESKIEWKANADAKSYHVYLGTDKKAVEKAKKASKLFKGNTTETKYDSSKLDFRKTYYFRIDTVGNDGKISEGVINRTNTGLVKGYLWSFTTMHKPIKEPARTEMPVMPDNDYKPYAPPKWLSTIVSVSAGLVLIAVGIIALYFGRKKRLSTKA